MSDSNVKLIAIILGVFCIWSVFFRDTDQFNVNVQTKVAAADGLDLKAIGPLLKKAKDAAHLEKLLNDPSVGINNLDLNEDDKVDYINVTEYGKGNDRGFSLTTDFGKGEIQEIASIQVEKKGDNADVQIKGNQQIYGHNHYHHSSFSSLSTILLMSYMFSPHPFYRSPWGYGYHPPYYSPYSRRSSAVYRNQVSRTSANSSFTRSSSNKLNSQVTSPHSGKSSSKVRAPLRAPTRSQKSFQARNPSKRIRSGGFGRASSTTRSVRRSSFGRSSGGFGRGK